MLAKTKTAEIGTAVITIPELNKYLKSAEGTRIRRMISPQVAKHIIENFNQKNSKVQQKSVIAYAQHMLNNNWIYDGQPITFTWEPLLASGQHRLLACIKSECAFETDLTFGHDPKMRFVRNSGKRDKPHDYLALAGWKNPEVVAGAIRWIQLHNENIGQLPGRSTWHPTFYPELAKTFNRESLEHCVKTAKIIHKNVPHVPAQYVAAVYYLARQNEKKYADEFFEDWANGQPPHPARQAQKAFLAIATAKGNKSGKDWDKFVIIIDAWNKFYSGNSKRYGRIGEWNPSLNVPPIIGGNIE